MDIVVSVVGASESSVESIGTLVVAVAHVVGQVESVGDSSTSWVTASRWQVGTALVAGKIEILSLVASEGGVESILASEVGCAEVIDSVESVGTSSTSWILASAW